MDSKNLSEDEMKYMDSKNLNEDEMKYMDSKNLNEDEMKYMADKASNWGYTDLTPLTEDENKIMNAHVKYLKEMEKNYKPTEPITFPEPFPKVKISDEIKKLFLSGEQVTNFTPEIMSQNGGVLSVLSPITLIMRLWQLKTPANTVILIFKPLPTGRIILDNGNYDIDVYMFTTANPNNIENVNPFNPQFPESPFHPNITDTLRSTRGGNGVIIQYQNEEIQPGIHFHNYNTLGGTTPLLHNHVFFNYVPNAFNVGFEHPQRMDVIKSVVHTDEDVRTMNCITKRWDRLMNPWWYTKAYTGVDPAVRTWLALPEVNQNLTNYLESYQAPPGCRKVQGNLDMSHEGRIRLIQEMQVKRSSI